MAGYRSSMRMGALNLLILVIAVSLAVLGVLALVTAQANVRLAERQASSVSEIYVEDAAGQFFLQRLDHELANAANSGTGEALSDLLSGKIQGMVQDAAAVASMSSVDVEGSAAVLDVELLYAEMGVSEDLLEEMGICELPTVSGTETIEPDATPMADAASNDEASDGNAAAEGSKRDVHEVIHEVVVLEEIGSRNIEAAPLENSKPEYAASLKAYIEDCICGISADFSIASGRNLHCVLAINNDYSYKVLSWKITKAWPEGSQNEGLWLG